MSDPADLTDPQEQAAARALRERLAGREGFDLSGALRARGAVIEVGDGVARVVGLGDIGADELVTFGSGACGMAYDIAPDHTGVVLLTGADLVQAGHGAHATGRLPMVSAGPSVLGRIIDPLGVPLDDQPRPHGEPRPVLRDAPQLIERAPVERSLHTGILAIDAAIPIGRGQRQLILGDRNVGKTAVALDIVAAQKGQDVVCVYVVVGQPLSRVLAIRDTLHASGALDHTVLVAADAAHTPAMQYLAPYSGSAIAESFRERGQDTVVVYDDLTKHADAYRELALLLERPPGREAFPGDIFYIHGELLERASAFSDAVGGGSITAFPIVETTDSDISSYIPTNLISITDGQVYLDTARFERNHRPPIDIGRSVSRIGGVAQSPSLRAASKNLRIQVSRFEALEAITRVGLDVDPNTQAALDRGRVLRELLRQARFSPRSVADQVLMLHALSSGGLDGLSPRAAREVVEHALRRAPRECAELVAGLDRGDVPEPDAFAPFSALVAELRTEIPPHAAPAQPQTAPGATEAPRGAQRGRS